MKYMSILRSRGPACQLNSLGATSKGPAVRSYSASEKKGEEGKGKEKEKGKREKGREGTP